jgi:hypothetical protein
MNMLGAPKHTVNSASTLRLIKTLTRFFSFLSIKPAMLLASMLGDYSTSASLTPSCFLRRTDFVGNLFLIMSLLDLHFSSFFLDHHTGHLTHHDARILLYECILDAL